MAWEGNNPSKKHKKEAEPWDYHERGEPGRPLWSWKSWKTWITRRKYLTVIPEKQMSGNSKLPPTSNVDLPIETKRRRGG